MTGILSAFFIIPYVTPPPPTTPARMIAAALRPACFTAVPAAVFAAFSAIAAGCFGTDPDAFPVFLYIEYCALRRRKF